MGDGRHSCFDSLFGLNNPGEVVRFTIYVSRPL